MIAVDTNILVYAHRLDSPSNQSAHQLIMQLAAGPDRWAIAWPSVFEFLGIVTHPKIYHQDPTPMPRAVAQVAAWRNSGHLILLAEHGGTFDTLQQLLAAGAIAGPRVHDAKIAAICLSHDVAELWTADRDFEAFPDLRTRNPLTR